MSSKCVSKRSARNAGSVLRGSGARARSSCVETSLLCAVSARKLRLLRPRAPMARRSRAQALIALRARGGARSVAFRAQRTAFAHGIERVRSGAFLHGAPRALLHLRHSPPSVSLTTVRVARVPFRSRAAADQFASLISTPCASLPRDCPILRPRAGLCLSQGPATLRSR